MGYAISKVNGVLTADEARKQTGEIMSSTDESLMEMVRESIKKAIDDGNYYCWIYTTLTSRAITHLKNLGYKVSNESSQRDGEMHKIEW